MLMNVAVQDKSQLLPNFSTTHLLVACPTLSLCPHLRSQVLAGEDWGGPLDLPLSCMRPLQPQILWLYELVLIV